MSRAHTRSILTLALTAMLAGSPAQAAPAPSLPGAPAHPILPLTLPDPVKSTFPPLPSAQHPAKQVLIRTGNNLDVAIVGDGYIALETPAGPRYTRVAMLRLEGGRLVTREGLPVRTDLGFGVLRPAAPVASSKRNAGRTAAIRLDGSVATSEGRVLGRIVLTRFPRPRDLTLQKNGFFVAGPQCGKPERGNPGERGFGVLVAGYLERQNEEGQAFRQGSICRTGNSFDLAITGEGFLGVRTASGVRYTRDGSLAVRGERELVHAGGHPLLTQDGKRMTLPKGATHPCIESDGSVSVVAPDGAVVRLGQLLLTRFENPQGLSTSDGCWYQETSAAGRKVVGTPAQTSEQLGTLAQGFQEVPEMRLPVSASLPQDLHDLIELATHDLNNLFTPGYRAAMFDLQGLLHRPRGAARRSASTIQNQGQVFSTNIDTEVAVNGPGFLVVRDGAGVRFTRDGRFSWKEGRLVDSADRPVLAFTINDNGMSEPGEVRIDQTPSTSVLPDGNARATFDAKGFLLLTPAGASTPLRPKYRLVLALFPDDSRLGRVDDTGFLETSESGSPFWGVPANGEFGRIVPHSLEMSNVDPARARGLIDWAWTVDFWARAVTRR